MTGQREAVKAILGIKDGSLDAEIDIAVAED